MGLFGIKGPKALLASAISSALDEYFIVDPKKVKSNLLSDANITLRNVQLRPYQSIIECSKDTDIVVDVYGMVDLVTFSWEWSIPSSNESLVKDATLTISGIKFKTKLSYGCVSGSRQKQPSMSESKEESDLTKITKEGSLQRYIREQVEHIINALKLCVTDFEFTLELPSCDVSDDESRQSHELNLGFSGIVAGGKRIELTSIGNEPNTKGNADEKAAEKLFLKQQLSLDCIFIEIFSSSSKNVQTRYPLMDKFSYQASANRFNQKRFGSLSTGLKFVGTPVDARENNTNAIVKSTDSSHTIESEGSSCITFHAGLEQIDVLTRLSNIFLQRESSSTSSTTKNETEESTEPPTKEEGVENDQYEALKDEVLSSSIFIFSISGISLVLHNGTKITLQKFSCCYHADGTVMKIEGDVGSGILVDDFPLIATKSFEDDSSQWIIDFISSKFSIRPTVQDQSGKNDAICTIQIRPDLIQNIYNGVTDAVDLTTQKLNLKAGSLMEGDDGATTESKSKWSIEIYHLVTVHLNDINSKQSTILRSISLNFDSFIFDFESQMLKCNGINVTSNPPECISITVPSITQMEQHKGLCVNGQISIIADSLICFEEIGDYFGGFVTDRDQTNEVIETETNSSFMAKNTMHILLPSVKLNILGSQYYLDVNTISLQGSTLHIQLVSFQDGIGTSIETSGIRISNDKNLVAQVDKIQSLDIPDLFALKSPIQSSEITYDGKVVTFKFKDIYGKMTMTEDKESHTSASTGSKFSIPVPINLYVHQLGIETTTDGKDGEKESIEAFHVTFDITPNSRVDSSTNLYDLIQLQFDELKTKLVTVSRAEFSSFVNMEMNELRDLSFSTLDPILIYIGQSLIFNSMASSFHRKNDEHNKPIVYELPFSKIGKLKLDFSYKMSLLSAENIEITVDAFEGSSATTSNDLLKYYNERIVKHVPGLLQETKILGAGILDMVVVGGTMVVSSIPFAGIAAIMGFDMVKNTLKAGKESRNAESNDKFQIGDFTRGLVYSARKTKMAGKKIRNKGKEMNENEGDPLDFVIGSSSVAVEYVDENKRKLGTAGGVCVGMLVGTAVGGPIGAVVGGVVGGFVASETIEFGEKHQQTNSKLEADKDSPHIESIQDSQEIGKGQDNIHGNSIGPRGFLYRRRNTLKWEWEPFWYTLDLSKQVLKRHKISQNAPPKIDTKPFSVFNSLSQKRLKEKDKSAIQVSYESVESIDLTKCKVKLSESLSSDKFKLFAFTISTKKNKLCKKEWHMASDTRESRRMWMIIIAEMTGNAKVLEKVMKSIMEEC